MKQKTDEMIPYFVKQRLSNDQERNSKIIQYYQGINQKSDLIVEYFQVQDYYILIFNGKQSITLEEFLKICSLQKREDENLSNFIKFLCYQLLIEYQELCKIHLTHNLISTEKILLYGENIQVLPKFSCSKIFYIKFLLFSPKENVEAQKEDEKQLTNIIQKLEDLRQKFNKNIIEKYLQKNNNITFENILNKYQNIKLEVFKVKLKLQDKILNESLLHVQNRNNPYYFEIGYIQQLYYKMILQNILNNKKILIIKEIELEKLQQLSLEFYFNQLDNLQKKLEDAQKFLESHLNEKFQIKENLISEENQLIFKSLIFIEFLQWSQDQQILNISQEQMFESLKCRCKCIEEKLNQFHEKFVMKYFTRISTQIVNSIEEQL